MMEFYETFYTNTLDTFILRGKRNKVAEMRKMIHNAIEQALWIRMEEVKPVMKFFRAQQATLLDVRGASNKTSSLFILFIKVVVTKVVLVRFSRTRIIKRGLTLTYGSL